MTESAKPETVAGVGENPDPNATTQLDTSKAVDPNASTAEAGTPIHDELASGNPTDEHPEPLPADEAKTVVADAPDSSKSFKVDVERALARETQDGKGDSEPGPSNFESFATEGVEKEGSA